MNIFFFKQKTAYEMRISDWSSDVCSSDLLAHILGASGEIAVLHRRELLRNGGDLGHHGRFGVAAVGLDAAFDAADQAPRVQHLQVGFQQDRKSTRLNSSH